MSKEQVDWSRNFRRFNAQPAASLTEVRRFEAASGYLLPEDYVAFLLYADGGDGLVGGDRGAYFIFWRVEDLIELNEAYQVEKLAPS